jgi:uracil-DNA glycosylase
MRPLVKQCTDWLQKCIGLIAAALLLALAATALGHFTNSSTKAVGTHSPVADTVMGRGGQFEKVLLW